MIGYVTQEIVIFNDTVANNVSLWSCDSNNRECMAKIKRAIEQAYCKDFVIGSSDGYNTHIGDRGIKLSVGQRQRLAIARELFKEPEILIFDEATSALDSKSETYIQESINSLKHKKTIVLIAHRLSTVKTSDYIYVLDKGHIIEEGTFSQLYNREGSRFRKMCDLQSF
jgi:subfamily B ATP-binding cassette protein MsbA